MELDILIAGGGADADVACIANAARRMNLSICRVVPSHAGHPALCWDPFSGDLRVEHTPVHPKGAFLSLWPQGGATTALQGDDCLLKALDLSWYTTLASWANHRKDLRLLNRRIAASAHLKGLALAKAAEAGLPVPKTLVTNAAGDTGRIGPDSALIAKPVAGGGEARAGGGSIHGTVDLSNGIGPAPAIIQEKLSYPEVRVFVIGGKVFAFETYAQTTDFREDPSSHTEQMSPSMLPHDLSEGLRFLARDLALDFCAFDLKTRQTNNELCVMAVDTAPRFSAFDQLCFGALSEAILSWLTQPVGPRPDVRLG